MINTDVPNGKKEQIAPANVKALNGSFVLETEKIAAYLLGLKQRLDLFDMSHASMRERIDHIESLKKSVFISLDRHFLIIWKIAGKFDGRSFALHQKYYQNMLLPLLSTPPLNKRIYEKPLGYPGDYIMMNYYHDDGYEGNSTYEMLMHRYSLELPVARAHINRKFFLQEKIRGMMGGTKGLLKITSLGCGPAKEILELLRDNRVAERCVFNCIDSEPLALEQIKTEVESAVPEKNRNISCLNLDVSGIIRRSKIYKSLRGQDLIYAAGLFDYFNDRIARAVLKAMYSLLADAGVLVVVNVAKGHNSLAYMEMLGEWYLHIRSEAELLSLADGIKSYSKKFVEKDRETAMNLYLIMEKGS